MNFTFTLGTFLLALAGLAFDFCLRWGAYWRNPDRPSMNPFAYLTLDLPGWIAAFIGAIGAYFALPELGAVTGASVAIGVTPLWSFAAGYLGASAGPKLMTIIAGRAGVR